MNALKILPRIKGTIRWFDGYTGEGMVRTEDGRSYYLHFTSINGISKNNYQWPSESDKRFLNKIQGVFCTFELDEYQAHNLEF
jgi:hypothetical protein